MILAWPIPRIGHDQAQYMATTHVQVNALGGAAGGHGRTGIQGGAIELHLEDDRGQAATDLIIHAEIGLEAATDTTQVIDNRRVRRNAQAGCVGDTIEREGGAIARQVLAQRFVQLHRPPTIGR